MTAPKIVRDLPTPEPLVRRDGGRRPTPTATEYSGQVSDDVAASLRSAHMRLLASYVDARLLKPTTPMERACAGAARAAYQEALTILEQVLRSAGVDLDHIDGGIDPRWATA